LASQTDRGFPEIDLSFARWMRQRQEDLLMRLIPGPDRILYDRLPSLEAVFIAQPLEDPLGRMPLLLGRLSVILQDLLDDRQEGR
jgi:hypothetical protein